MELNLAQALANLGASDEATAMKHLDNVLDLAPDDSRALYMLAWAQWRIGDHQASTDTLARAEYSGGPDSPEAWFFRGLAVHFDTPLVALASYRRASDLQAELHDFYP